MENVIYLLGAGASCGLRPANFANLDFTEHPDFVLPLVSEFSLAARFIANKYDHTVPASFLSTGEMLGPSNTQLSAFSKQLRHFSSLTEKTFSVDTLVRMFELAEEGNYIRARNFLGVVLEYYERNSGVDSRYESFFCSIIFEKNGKLKLPFNLSIVSWNYDLQIEKFFYQRLGAKGIDLLERFKSSELDDGVFCKLNGDISRGDVKEIVSSSANSATQTFLHELFANREDPLGEDDLYSNLHFSWNGRGEGIEDEVFKDGKELVVVGYSFPSYNRYKDTQLLGAFIFSSNNRGRKRIVIQCAGATDGVVERVKDRIGQIIPDQRISDFVIVVPYYETSEFYLSNLL